MTCDHVNASQATFRDVGRRTIAKKSPWPEVATPFQWQLRDRMLRRLTYDVHTFCDVLSVVVHICFLTQWINNTEVRVAQGDRRRFVLRNLDLMKTRRRVALDELGLDVEVLHA